MSNTSLLRAGVLAVGAFSAAYVLAAIVAAVVSGNGEFVFYIVVMLLLAGFVGYVHYRLNLSTGLLWCLSIWGALHMAGGLLPVPESWPINGEIRVLYSWWLIPNMLKFDHVVHAFGFATTTWLCWQGMCAATAGVRPTLIPLTLCAAAAMGMGAANEIVEFAATKLGPTNVGGYENTAWDLVANAVGAIVAAFLIRFIPVCVMARR